MQMHLQLQSNLQFYLKFSHQATLLKKTLWAEPSTTPLPLGRTEPNPQTLSIASVWADQPEIGFSRLARPRAREKEFESSLTAAATSSTATILTSLSSLLFLHP